MGGFNRIATTAERLRSAMESAGMRQSDLARAADIDKSALSRYLKGSYEPKQFFINKLAKVLNVSEMWLWGYDCPRERNEETSDSTSVPSSIIPMSQMSKHKIPLIGSVAAGTPILADQQYDVYVDSPAQADYALTIEGDSMEPLYLNGDVVYIKEQPDVDDGRVAVVLLDDSAALKHVYHAQDGLLLVSENTKYPPKHASFSEYDNIRILGVVVGFTRMYK